MPSINLRNILENLNSGSDILKKIQDVAIALLGSDDDLTAKLDLLIGIIDSNDIDSWQELTDITDVLVADIVDELGKKKGHKYVTVQARLREIVNPSSNTKFNKTIIKSKLTILRSQI